MDRFYFDVEDGKSERDEEGIELPGLAEVRHTSVKLLGEELCERDRSFWDDPELKITVRDDNDLILLRLTVFGTTAPAGR